MASLEVVSLRGAQAGELICARFRVIMPFFDEQQRLSLYAADERGHDVLFRRIKLTDNELKQWRPKLNQHSHIIKCALVKHRQACDWRVKQPSEEKTPSQIYDLVKFIMHQLQPPATTSVSPVTPPRPLPLPILPIPPPTPPNSFLPPLPVTQKRPRPRTPEPEFIPDYEGNFDDEV